MPHSVDISTASSHGDSTTMIDTKNTYVHLDKAPQSSKCGVDSTQNSASPDLDDEPDDESWSFVDTVFRVSDELSTSYAPESTPWNRSAISNGPWINDHTTLLTQDEEITLFDCPVSVGRGCKCACKSRVSKFDDLDRSHFTSESLHLSRQSHLLDQTAEWLFQSCRFREWTSTDGTPLFWLCGTAGGGKSMITSVILNRLAAYIRLGDVVTFYFNDGRFKNSNLARSILGEMLLGLLSQQEAGETRDHLESLSADLRRIGNRMSLSQMKFFFFAIRHSLRRHQTLWVILDGLDDAEGCQPGPDDVLSALLRLATTYDPKHRIKCFLSSRPDFLPRDMRRFSFQVDLDQQASARADLKRYVNQQTQSLPLFQDVRYSDLVEEVVSRANGIFLWVNLVMRELQSDMSSLAGNLRSSRIDGLAGIYNYLLDRVPAESHSTALLMLNWVVSAARPLHLKELGSLLQMDAEITATDVARISGGLLTTHTGQTVSLVHLSAKKYLQLPRYPHETIARTCLKSMRPIDLVQTLGFSSDGGMFSYSLSVDKPPFAIPYILYYWKFHYSLAEPHSDSLPGLLHSRLKHGFETQNFRACKESLPQVLSTRYKSSSSPFPSLLISNIALIAAVRHGFHKATRLELQLGATQHLANEPQTDTALHIAARHGDQEIIGLLLQYGAVVDQTSEAGFTALHLAVASGNSATVSALLRHGLSLSTFAPPSSCHEHEHCFCKTISNTDCEMTSSLTFETLSLAVTASEPCPECGQMSAEYIISPAPICSHDPVKRLSSSWAPIHITGDTISLAEASVHEILQDKKCHIQKSRSSLTSSQEPILIKWFSGVSMYEALRIASKLGIEDVRNLLLVAGNEASVINRIISIDHLLANLKII